MVTLHNRKRPLAPLPKRAAPTGLPARIVGQATKKEKPMTKKAAMAEYQAAKQKLRKEYLRKLSELSVEREIGKHIPKGIGKPRVFIHPLYGTEGSVTFKSDNPKAILAALPPIGMVLTRGTFTSFLHADCPEPDEPRGINSITDICPVRADIEGPSLPIIFRWFARIAGKVFDIKVECSKSNLSIRWPLRQFMGGKLYERPQFSAFDTTPGHHSERNSIVWASGSDEYPSRVTLYWIPVNQERDLAAESLDCVSSLGA